MSHAPRAQSLAARRHWRLTLWLTLGLLAIWLAVSLTTSLAPAWLNQWQFLGFPFGFYLAAQGALLVYLLIVGAHTALMNRMDRNYHGSRGPGADS